MSLAAGDNTFNLEGGVFSGRVIQLILITAVLSLAPSILIMVTSFTRIIVVLSFVRNALGIQQTPPNPVLISLALFLTFFIMTPTFTESYTKGIIPLMEEKIEESEAIQIAAAPFHKFMRTHTRQKDLELFLHLANIPEQTKIEDTPYHVLIPSFMISELRRAFEIGFLVFLPFIIIDMLVSSVLMAMGMMMLPPVMISLPFKLIYFVITDGWYMIAGSLVRSYTS
ncbi:flagellar type III secretion system pore protein FliP [Rickettsiales endosymbiont of Stachyamoeba lipophora]|uniref:flagellar type III secretion system pore protein FliP n=1 Tax=Rickettsiales endosymbiont of Stachyamoeba lipophora TaxID=2486578 RepID=UPI0019D15AA0|nr:flagellar type III secretion system pore protein FliP [Rickettsiales endosymbiont of Stachyamoeba lipophora]